jgi:membrane-associated phospholipid phosphatase
MIKGRPIWTLGAFVAAFMVFARIRSYADNTRIPVRYAYPVRIDRWLFNGIDPVTWLHNRLGQTSHLNVLDYLLVVVYISYFVVPPATVVLLWWFRSRWFRYVALSVVVTLYVGVAINFLVPTAPPWLAAEHGYLPDFQRLVPKLLNHVVPGIFNTGDKTAGPNDVAAMPSLHIAIVAVTSCYFMTKGTMGKVLGVLYICAMGFALVYLGEHYVSDIIAGFLIALGSWLAVSWVLNRRHARDESEQMSPELEKQEVFEST